MGPGTVSVIDIDEIIRAEEDFVLVVTVMIDSEVELFEKKPCQELVMAAKVAGEP